MKIKYALLALALPLLLLAGCKAAGTDGETTTTAPKGTDTSQTTETTTNANGDVPVDTSDYPDLLPEGVRPPMGSPLLRLTRAVYFFDEKEGFIALPYLFAAGSRESYVYHTADKGENWEIVHDTAEHHSDEASDHMNLVPDGLFFLDRDNGILVGNHWDYFEVCAYKTTDGGRTWRNLLGAEPGAENWENSAALLPMEDFGNDFEKLGVAFKDIFITPVDKASAIVSFVWQGEDGNLYENRSVYDSAGLHPAERADLGPAPAAE